MRMVNLRSNLYRITGQNDMEFFVLAKNIQDAADFHSVPKGCGADLVGLDSIKKIELVNEFKVTKAALERTIDDLVEAKRE